MCMKKQLIFYKGGRMSDISIEPGELLGVARAWKKAKVVVLGDLILDQFIYGMSGRVSREAPVIIVKYRGNRFNPGGAANAARNVSDLGGTAVPVGITGRDREGDRLKDILKGGKLITGGIIPSAERGTTSKTRIMAGDYHAQQQQIVRIDREEPEPVSKKLEDRIISRFSGSISGADAVLLSDYNQGLFTDRIIGEAISISSEKKIPVVADSRFNLIKFKGITTATPNEREAAEAAGTGLDRGENPDRAGRKLLKKLKASSILITMGNRGMSLYRRYRKARRVNVVGSPEATDVTGAGDTVASVIALSLAVGAEMETAMVLANIAASRVVMKRGTATVTNDELSHSIRSIYRTEE